MAHNARGDSIRFLGRLGAAQTGFVTRFVLLLSLTCSMQTVVAQVFTVGEKSATSDVDTEFHATHVELPKDALTERGRLELVRNLEAEQGFAHRILPLGGILTLNANGNLSPGPEGYRKLIYQKGQSAALGDRVAVTKLEFKPDRILVDLNGGPYAKHRFLSHVQVGVGDIDQPNPNVGVQATGCRIVLVFEGGTPELSAPEVKALLQPLVDFGAKTGELAYAETLPAPLKSAIASHEVLVGMNHRMVLAALGAPEHKVREQSAGGNYEEWIYGHHPQPIKFVRFVGDRVTLIKIAAAGKPIEVHNHDELGGEQLPETTHAVRVGDGPGTGEGKPAAPPTLRLPGDKAPVGDVDQSPRKVQFPDEHKPRPDPSDVPE